MSWRFAGRHRWPWSDDEDQQLRREYRNGDDVYEMAFAHERTEYAIRCRLEHIGLVGDRDAVPMDGPANANGDDDDWWSEEDYAYDDSERFSDEDDDDGKDEGDDDTSSVRSSVVSFEPDMDKCAAKGADAAHDATCVICTRLQRHPVVVVDCGHRFCQRCFERHRRSVRQRYGELNCPTCRCAIDEDDVNAAVVADVKHRRALARLPFRCHRRDTYLWVGPTGKHGAHSCTKPPPKPKKPSPQKEPVRNAAKKPATKAGAAGKKTATAAKKRRATVTTKTKTPAKPTKVATKAKKQPPKGGTRKSSARTGPSKTKSKKATRGRTSSAAGKKATKRTTARKAGTVAVKKSKGPGPKR